MTVNLQTFRRPITIITDTRLCAVLQITATCLHTQQNAPMTDILAALHSHKNLNAITNLENERTKLDFKILATRF